MSGIRLVLFGVTSDAGLGAMPPLSFFTGGAAASSPTLLEAKLFPAGVGLAREDLEELAT